MLFSSAVFVSFLAVTLLCYWALPWLEARRIVLIVASAVFYAWWDYRFLALLGYVILVAHAAGRALGRYPAHGKRWVTLTLVLQLGQLAVFKYANFLLASVGDLAHLLGSPLQPPKLGILLPIGVSFYTFHGISYVVDVYRGKLRPLKFSIVALYIVFFPQLVAGPIVRADQFIPQAERPATLTLRDLVVALKLVTLGLIYKSVLADRLGPLVDAVFAEPQRFDNVTLVSAALGFYAQIYFDFAGYSTMAIGISRLFGFKLPKNFDFPYCSSSITEFWRRWHISLSSWLRDYLYIPLGGNRAGTLQQYRNLMLTMLLGGLWHGASYNFVIWGAAHGLALAAHKLFRSRFPQLFLRGPARYVWLPLAWLLTQAVVLAAWVPFRTRSFSDTGVVLSSLVGVRADAGTESHVLPWMLVLLPIAADQLLARMPRWPDWSRPHRPLLVLALLAFSFVIVLTLVVLDVQNFIYFQF